MTYEKKERNTGKYLRRFGINYRKDTVMFINEDVNFSGRLRRFH